MIMMPQVDRAILAHRDVILRDLRRLVGADHVIDEESGRRVFETDAWTEQPQMPLAVVMPASTAEVSKVLAFALKNRIKVVPRGAGTSTSGASVPSEDAIVICLSRMNEILDIDFPGRFVKVQAGVSSDAINRAVKSHGYSYMPDPASGFASTIAGNLATDAGGARALKYGMSSHHVLGMTLVLMDGEIIELGGRHLDAPGYDIAGLITGSEGQLGIITEAHLRIIRSPEAARPVLLSFGSVQGAGQCVAAILKAGVLPRAIEFMDRTAIEACEAFAHAGYPTDVEALLIVEVEGSPAEISSLQSRIVEATRVYGPSIVRVGQTEEQSAAIWKGRNNVLSAIAKSGDSVWLDATVPLGRLAEVLEGASAVCKSQNMRSASIYRAGDGCLRPILMFDAADKGARKRAAVAAEQILRLCIDVGGTLSGEGGIGLQKRDLMTLQFSDGDLAIQMRLKSAFDPDWLLNTAKMFPLEGRPAVLRDLDSIE